MSFPDRHKVEELVALYELEPTIRDVYVEGETDEAFFEWFLAQTAPGRVEVKGIDSVEVPRCRVSTRCSGPKQNERWVEHRRG